jgi:hypothetical protein
MINVFLHAGSVTTMMTVVMEQMNWTALATLALLTDFNARAVIASRISCDVMGTEIAWTCLTSWVVSPGTLVANIVQRIDLNAAIIYV